MLFTRTVPMINYDSAYDVLYYKIGDTSNSYGDEDIDDIIILRDLDTDAVTGYTIMNFKHICDEKSEVYEELEKIIDVEKALEMC